MGNWRSTNQDISQLPCFVSGRKVFNFLILPFQAASEIKICVKPMAENWYTMFQLYVTM